MWDTFTYKTKANGSFVNFGKLRIPKIPSSSLPKIGLLRDGDVEFHL
jgi:hypothetical protein